MIVSAFMLSLMGILIFIGYKIKKQIMVNLIMRTDVFLLNIKKQYLNLKK